jgi:hypothetical protein
MRSFQVHFLIHTLFGIDLSLVRPGYEASISSLVEVTRDVVQEKLKSDVLVRWVIAQRASLQVKIEACAR